MIAAIRIRGTAAVGQKIRETLENLRLFKSNHLVLVSEANKRMAIKVKDMITFGEISEETLTALLQKRGLIEGNKKITEEYLKSKKVSGFSDLAKQIMAGKKLKDFGLEMVFRLSPPRKGHERGGVKKSYKIGGALGYRGKDINELIMRMI